MGPSGLGGVVVVETVFGIGGSGQDSAAAIDQGNLPLIIGFVLAAAVFVIVAHILVDTAFAGTSSTYYAGKNAQGQKLLFSVDQTANGPRFDPFFTTIVTRCPATGNRITIEFSFIGFEIPITNGKFSISLNDLSDRFTWAGMVTPKKATGTEFYDLAAFDNQKGLQDCASGTVPWAALALAPASKPAAPHTSYNVTVTKAADGSVHYTVTH